MQWTKLTNDNVPNEEVLAIGYQEEMLIGYIHGKEEDAIGFVCISEESELTECKFYITSKELRMNKPL